jgi:hypothetical protein
MEYKIYPSTPAPSQRDLGFEPSATPLQGIILPIKLIPLMACFFYEARRSSSCNTGDLTPPPHQ